MKIFIAGPLPDHARNLMRRLGYAEQRTRAGQISYVKRAGGGARFPRYHAYVEDLNGGIQINLHVDQKEASYKGSSAHSGDYEGLVVEREIMEMKAFITSLKSTSSVQTTSTQPKKKTGFISKFF